MAARIRASSSPGRNGFSIKSSAPRSNALILLDSVPRPETTKIGIVVFCLNSCSRRSPVVSGSPRSRRTAANPPSDTSAKASRPVPTDRLANPPYRTAASSTARTAWSSSTMSSFAANPTLLLRLPSLPADQVQPDQRSRKPARNCAPGQKTPGSTTCSAKDRAPASGRSTRRSSFGSPCLCHHTRKGASLKNSASRLATPTFA